MSRPPPGCGRLAAAARGRGPRLVRDLGDYDRAFGVSLDGQVRDGRDPVKQIAYLAAALKAPRIREAAARLADQARDAGWTPRGLPCRGAGARGRRPQRLRRRSCGSAPPGSPPARPWRSSTSTTSPAPPRRLGALGRRRLPDQSPQRRVARPAGTGKTHLATALGIAACHAGHRVLFATATDWVTRLQDAHRAAGSPANWPGSAATG